MARRVSKMPEVVVEVETQRLDKWLWFARVAKTRTLAASLVASGRVRVNRNRVTKPAQTIRAGDVITVSVARGVRVLKIISGGTRRGPATEAATLFDEIVPIAAPPSSPSQQEKQSPPTNQGYPEIAQGSGRPTKKDRRILDRLNSRNQEE